MGDHQGNIFISRYIYIQNVDVHGITEDGCQITETTENQGILVIYYVSKPYKLSLQ